MMPDVDAVIAPARGLGAAFSLIAAVRAAHPAIVCGSRRLTWAEADAHTNRLAAVLSARGLRPGDLLAIALPNRVEFVELIVAAWKLGATPLPLNWRMPDQERLEIEALAQPRLRIGETPAPGELPTLLLDDLLTEAARAEPRAHPDVPTSPWKAVTSGGSTGRPKVILAQDGGPRGEAVRTMWGARAWGATLLGGPLYFNGPFTRGAMTLLAGSTLVLMERFDAEEYLSLIQRERITWSLTVPTMWSRIMQLPAALRTRHDLSSLETMLHSGAPMAEWLKREVIGFLGAPRVMEMYGATEVAGTIIGGEEWLAHPGSVGRALPGYRIEIRADDGTLLPAGEIGEIWIRPPGRPTFAYLGAQPRIDGEFVSVGDLGRLDADGYLTIADRRTDLILTGGSNVYPAEVEGVLLQHPGVRDVVVVGLPDPAWGQRVHAIVEARDALAAPTGETLAAWARTRLSGYKRPKTYELVDAIPRDAAGKLRRQALRDARS